MTKVLVLGGYGAVGIPLMKQLAKVPEISAYSAGRDPARADVVVDLKEPGAYSTVVRDFDVVGIAVGCEEGGLGGKGDTGGVALVDITATSSYCEELEAVDGPVLMGVGLAPGLTSVLATEAHRLGDGPVDILIGLGGGELHGPAATAWTYGMLGTRFSDPDGRSVRNYTGMKTFRIPADVTGYRTGPAVRADFSDQHALTRDLGVPVRTYLRLDTSTATLGLAAMTWAPALQKVVPKKLWGSDRWVAMARADTGPALWVSGRSQSVATAAIAARAVQVIRDAAISKPTWFHAVETTESLQAAVPELSVRQWDGASRSSGKTVH